MDALTDLPVEQIEPMPGQPRGSFEPIALAELARSIASEGVIQPIVVRKVSESRYEIVAGERRWRACQLAQLDRVPCIVKDVVGSKAFLHALIENIQREDLTPVEEAMSLERVRLSIVEEGGKGTHEEIAGRVTKSRKWVTTTLSILKLSKVGIRYFMENPSTLTKGHAIALQGLEQSDEIKLIDQILHNNWSVRRIEKEAAKVRERYKGIKPQFGSETDGDIRRLETQISEAIGAKVTISVNPQTEAVDLNIRTWGKDPFDGILERLGIDPEA